jgi:hypothetical protein
MMGEKELVLEFQLLLKPCNNGEHFPGIPLYTYADTLSINQYISMRLENSSNEICWES